MNRILDDFPALGEGLGSAVLFLLWAAVVGAGLGCYLCCCIDGWSMRPYHSPTGCPLLQSPE